MPAIRIIPRLQDDNVCPPSRPFCRDTFFDVKDNPNLPPISDQTSTNSEEGQRSYAGLIVVLVIFAVSFILWLTWAKWPRTAVKALWKKISLKRKGGDGIHSPQLLKSAADEGTQSAMQEDAEMKIDFCEGLQQEKPSEKGARRNGGTPVADFATFILPPIPSVV